ncbi:MAG: hypothetical protein LBP96_02965 [Bacteroidales bacterium]|jgi:hypothetical protein|nr:hypothetical protein [Bacteroidales bacterium]
MKKVLKSMLFLGAMSVAFTSCGDDEKWDGQKITVATANDVEDVPSSVVQVAATFDGGFMTFTNTPFANKRFSMEIADEVNTSFLIPGDMGGELTVTPANTKIAIVAPLGYSSTTFNSSSFKGEFYHEKTVGDVWSYEEYIFAENDVIISGVFTEILLGDEIEITVDYNLKKGWNKVYAIEDFDQDKDTWTSTPVAGLTWTFSADTKKGSKRRASEIRNIRMSK